MEGVVHGVEKKTETPPNLSEIIVMIAIIGGFPNRKCDGNPGPTVLWRGLNRLCDFALGFSLGRAYERGG